MSGNPTPLSILFEFYRSVYQQLAVIGKSFLIFFVTLVLPRHCDSAGQKKNFLLVHQSNSNLATRSDIDPARQAEEQAEIRKAQRNPEAFQPLYDRYFEQIFSFVYRRTDGEELAADLTSQTFLKALQSIRKYKDRGLPFSAWLYRIAANEVNAYYRKTKRRQVFSLEEEVVGRLIDDEPSPNMEPALQALMQELSTLPTDDVAIIELRFFEEKSFREIAYILDLSESAAKMRTYRAIEKLKENLTLKLRDPDEQA